MTYMILASQAISILESSRVSLLGSFSNNHMHFPILSVGASAARAGVPVDVGTNGYLQHDGNYLLSVQPDVYSEMEALVRFILHMKKDRADPPS